jgi:thiol-disulfide isomerase/thioredoxin
MKIQYWLSLFTAFSVLIFSCQSGKNAPLQAGQFRVNGIIEQTEGGVVYLLQEVDGALKKVDSTAIRGGEFTLEGEIASPEMFFLQVNNSDEYARVFLTATEISVQLDVQNLAKAAVSGSPVHDEYAAAMAIVTPYEEELNHLFEWFRNPKITLNAEMNDSISKLADDIYLRQNTAIQEWVETHYNSPAAAYMVNRFLIFEADYALISRWADAFSAQIPDNKYVQLLVERKAILAASADGMQAPDFQLPDSNGVALSVSSLKGKVVLIDFWASWCGPCRRENPNVVKIYDEYSSRNFEILGVSFDESREAWLQAVREDQLPWLHVSDLQGWRSSAGILYGINSIPHTVLLDTAGKVVGHNLSGDALRTKLEELL